MSLAFKHFAEGSAIGTGSYKFRHYGKYEDLDYVYFDGSGDFEMPFNLEGSDTMRIKFETYDTGNLCGYYVSGSATNNFCVYAGSSSYVRYDGGVKRNWNVSARGIVHDAVFSPEGYSDNGTTIDTWTEKEFTCGHPLLGMLPNSSSAHAKFCCYSFAVDGKCNLIPKKRLADGAVGLLDTISGTFYTGSFLHETRPMTLMGGNPFSGGNNDDDGGH